MLSGGAPGPHPIQGIGAGFVPGNFHADAVNGVDPGGGAGRLRLRVSGPPARKGCSIGVSSGAVLAAVAKKLPEIKDGARILAFTYDTGERYLSVPGLFDVEPEAVAVRAESLTRRLTLATVRRAAAPPGRPLLLRSNRRGMSENAHLGRNNNLGD